MGGVRNIMVRAGADFSQLSQAMQRAQGEASVFGSNMEGILTRIGLVGNGIKTVFEAVVHTFEGLSEFAKEAGELDGRLSSLNARLGESANAFQQWAQSNEQALGMSKKDIIEQGASISAMLQTSISNKQQLASATEGMLKNIAIVSSATGKSQQEVSERIVSALQGHSAAVSALDLNMHLSSLRMTQAYKEIAGSSPWAKLTAEQQQMIIVSALNEQIQQRFGTTVVEDVATRMNRFTAALSDVKTNLEQAFTPILYRILPILTTFINYINTALSYVTAFFQVLFGYSGAPIKALSEDINGQADAVNNLANAHQKLNGSNKSGAGGISVPKVKTSGIGNGGPTTEVGGKKSGTGFVASFDQVHTITEDKGSGGSKSGGAGAAGGAGGVPDISGATLSGANQAGNIMDGLRQKVQGTVEAIKKFWQPFGEFFKGVWNTVKTYFEGVVDGLVKFWNQHGAMFIQGMQNVWNAIKPIIMWLAKFIWDSIKGVIDGVINFFEGLIEFLGGVFTGHWREAFNGLLKMVAGFIQVAWNFFNLTLFGGIKKLLAELLVNGAKAFIDLAAHFEKPLGDFFIWLAKGVSDAVKGIISFFSDFGSWLESHAVSWAHNFFDFFNGIVNAGKNAYNGLLSVFGGLYDWFMRSLVYPLTSAFNNISNGIGGSITGGLKAVWNMIADDINTAIDFINGITGNLPGGGALNISWRAPHLAKGGITNGPMMAVIGDNVGGQEVVTPLDRLQGMMANTIAQTINTVMAMQGGNKNNGMQSITLNVDGKTFARIMKPYLDNENLRVGTNVRLNTI